MDGVGDGATVLGRFPAPKVDAHEQHILSPSAGFVIGLH
jgi:hypothetical protein